MKSVRVATIGCGEHSRRSIHPSIAEAGLALAACCDLDAGKAEQMAVRYAGGRFYMDWREMCRHEEVDAVLVIVGPRVHHELSLELTSMGYHVWTEKPPAETATASEEVERQSASTARIVQTGFNYRYTIAVRSARRMIETGAFADPGLVAVRWWLGDDDPRMFGWHYVVHAVDLLGHLAGPLGSMSVKGSRRGSKRWYQATFETPRGCLAVLELSNSMPIQQPWCRIDWMSETGLLSAVDFYRLELAHGGEGRPVDEEHNYDALPGNQWWSPPYYGGWRMALERWGYIPELVAFRRAVQGEIAPESTIHDAARSMRITEEILRD